MKDWVIVTAISSNMWHDYLVFYDSIRRHHDYHIYIICIEMADWQLDTLKEHTNITVLILNQDLVVQYRETDAHWRQWHKPYYFSMIPHDHETVLWLDSDTVILDSLDPIFEMAEKRFVVVADYFAPKTCMNNPELYKRLKIDIPKEKNNIVLNSGVVGFQPIRDKHIIKLWKRKVEIASKDKELQSWIALYDQGALLWTLQELGLYNNIISKKAWNHPAKKNGYELASASTERMVKAWPMNNNVVSPGDVIDHVKIDNPDIVIAHFAGLPKLAHLCEPNHQHSLAYFRRKNGHREIRRTFIVGLERAGIQTMTNVLRQSCTSESWVRSGLKPTLAAEAQARHYGLEYKTHEFLERLELYARQDCGFVCEGNKNLTYFIKDIQERLEGNGRFIVMLRDPINLIRSRLLNFVTWPDLMYLAPECYQSDYRKFMCLGHDTSNNYYRLKPHYDCQNLIDLHIWEIEHQLRELARVSSEISPQSCKYVWIENLRAEVFHVSNFSGGQRIDPHQAAKVATKKIGVGLKLCSQETLEWVEAELANRLAEIYQKISALIAIPFRGI